MDEAKKLKTRFKKSKDFYKTIEKLKQQGYVVYHSEKEDKGIVENGVQTNKKIIMVGKNKLECLITIIYEENNCIDSEYKQSIHYILY